MRDAWLKKAIFVGQCDKCTYRAYDASMNRYFCTNPPIPPSRAISPETWDKYTVYDYYVHSEEGSCPNYKHMFEVARALTDVELASKKPTKPIKTKKITWLSRKAALSEEELTELANKGFSIADWNWIQSYRALKTNPFPVGTKLRYVRKYHTGLSQIPVGSQATVVSVEPSTDYEGHYGGLLYVISFEPSKEEAYFGDEELSTYFQKE